MLEMEVECDIISSLPEDIMERIVSRLPLRDALRTSILSRKWRYRWVNVPRVIFNDKMFKSPPAESQQIMKHRLANAIFQVLLLHTGPIVEFMLNTKFEMGYEIDQIILYLSRTAGNKLQHLYLINNLGDKHYKVPCSLFSMQGLEFIDLLNCEFKLPSTFNGFSKLTGVRLQNVEITANMLLLFLASCPLLEELELLGHQNDITRGNNFTLIDLLQCLPSVKDLEISYCYVQKFFFVDLIPRPFSLDHITSLSLGVSFMNQKQVSSMLYLISNARNLLLIYLELVFGASSEDFLHLQDTSGLKLDHLEELEIVDFSNFGTEMEFVKLVMAKSCVLKKLRLQLKSDMSVAEERRMFADIIWLPLPRASPSAKFIIERKHI